MVWLGSSKNKYVDTHNERIQFNPIKVRQTLTSLGMYPTVGNCLVAKVKSTM